MKASVKTKTPRVWSNVTNHGFHAVIPWEMSSCDDTPDPRIAIGASRIYIIAADKGARSKGKTMIWRAGNGSIVDRNQQHSSMVKKWRRARPVPT